MSHKNIIWTVRPFELKAGDRFQFKSGGEIYTFIKFIQSEPRKLYFTGEDKQGNKFEASKEVNPFKKMYLIL